MDGSRVYYNGAADEHNNVAATQLVHRLARSFVALLCGDVVFLGAGGSAGADCLPEIIDMAKDIAARMQSDR